MPVEKIFMIFKVFPYGRFRLILPPLNNVNLTQPTRELTQ
jgi:hypothetical protein